MANNFITNSVVKRYIVWFKYNATIYNTAYFCDSPYYKGQSVGESYQIRKNGQILSDRGYTSAVQNIVDRTFNVTVQEPFNVHTQINPAEFDRASGSADGSSRIDRIIKPASNELVQKVEKELIARMDDTVYHAVGTPGAAMDSWGAFTAAKVLMDDYQFPATEKSYLALGPQARNEVAGAFVNNYNQKKTGVILNTGYIAEEMGGYNEIFANTQMPFFSSVITNGTTCQTAAVIAEGASTIQLSGLGTYDGAIIPKGTCIEFDATQVRGVTDNQSETPRGFQCRVTADSAAIAAGAVTVTVTPEISLLGNVAKTPYANASVVGGGTEIPTARDVTLIGTYKCNYAYMSPGIALDPVSMGEMRGFPQAQHTEQGVYMTIVDWSSPNNWTASTRISTQQAWGFDPRLLVLVRT